MKWVWGSESIEKAPSARSDLPCPNIIRDGLSEPLQHQADGRWYDSKRAMAKATRDAGCVEVGNEQPIFSSTPLSPCTKDDVAQAYEQVKQGYKPQTKVEGGLPKGSGWF